MAQARSWSWGASGARDAKVTYRVELKTASRPVGRPWRIIRGHGPQRRAGWNPNDEWRMAKEIRIL